MYPGRSGAGGNGPLTAFDPGPSSQTVMATVQQALDEQEKQLAEFNQVLCAFKERLSVVLASDSGKDVASAPPPTPSNIVDRIRSHSRFIGFEVNQLVNLMQRLQV